jgi:hypothetical protein
MEFPTDLIIQARSIEFVRIATMKSDIQPADAAPFMPTCKMMTRRKSRHRAWPENEVVYGIPEKPQER